MMLQPAIAYHQPLQIEESSWNRLQFVSVKDGEILGFMEAIINRVDEHVSSLRVLNFGDMSYTFSKDFRQFLEDL